MSGSPTPRWARLLLPTALVLGIGMRAFMVTLPPVVTPDSTGRYEAYARNLIEGHGFSARVKPPYRPGAGTQPGYPLLLAAIYGVAGESRQAVVAVQVLGLDLLLVLCVALIARASGLSPLARSVATALALLCPVLPVIARAIWSECLATLVVWVSVLFGVRITRAATSLWAWAAFGACAGLALLVRPDLPPVIALVAAVLAWAAWRRSRAEAIRGVSVAAVGLVLALTPWMVRNVHALGAPLPLGTSVDQLSSPYQRWLGTWMDDRDDMPAYWWYAGNRNYPDTFPADKVIDADERARADALLQAGRRAINTPEADVVWNELTAKARSERPLRTLVVVPVSRVVKLWLNTASYVKQPVLRGIVTLLWGTFLLACVAGFVVAARAKRVEAYLFAAVVLGRSVLPLGIGIACEPRYIAEAIPALFLLFGFSVDALVSAVSARLRARS